jgi:uncharacterized membrane protein
MAVIGAVVLAALAFRPWDTLRVLELRNAAIAALVLLPLLWAAQCAAAARLPAQLSGACLLVLMLGWPLAVLALVAVAVAGAWLAGGDARFALELALWNGVLPATLGLAIGVAMRRWLPRQLFVYILGRAFIGTALAVCIAAGIRVWTAPRPPGTDTSALLAAAWMMAWGEAFLTGALAAIFVAFRPGWLLTYSDARYLPRTPRVP